MNRTQLSLSYVITYGSSSVRVCGMQGVSSATIDVLRGASERPPGSKSLNSNTDYRECAEPPSPAVLIADSLMAMLLNLAAARPSWAALLRSEVVEAVNRHVRHLNRLCLPDAGKFGVELDSYLHEG